eukprot:COSAG01_NODE_15064_length_1378_cov_36.887412_1_plen_128_part_00
MHVYWSEINRLQAGTTKLYKGQSALNGCDGHYNVRGHGVLASDIIPQLHHMDGFYHNYYYYYHFMITYATPLESDTTISSARAMYALVHWCLPAMRQREISAGRPPAQSPLSRVRIPMSPEMVSMIV